MSSCTFHFKMAGIEIYSHFSFNLAQYSGVNNLKTMFTSLKAEYRRQNGLNVLLLVVDTDQVCTPHRLLNQE